MLRAFSKDWRVREVERVRKLNCCWIGQGFKDVSNVGGGYLAWTENVFPVKIEKRERDELWFVIKSSHLNGCVTRWHSIVDAILMLMSIIIIIAVQLLAKWNRSVMDMSRSLARCKARLVKQGIINETRLDVSKLVNRCHLPHARAFIATCGINRVDRVTFQNNNIR